MTFTVAIEKGVTSIYKNEEQITKNIFYILEFIDSARLIAISLSNFVNYLFEGIHRIKCKFGHNDKKCELVELNISIAPVFLNTQILKMMQKEFVKILN